MTMVGGLTQTKQVINAFYFDSPASDRTREYNHLQGGYTWATSRMGRNQHVPSSGVLTDFYWRVASAESTVDHQLDIIVNGAIQLTMYIGISYDSQ